MSNSWMEMVLIARDALLNFLVELTAPIGPEVFAGFGSKIQDRIADNQFAYFDIIKEWSDQVDVENTLTLLFDIAFHPPDAIFIHNFYGRFQELWNHVLADLIYYVGMRDTLTLKRIIEKYKNHKSLQTFISEIESDISENRMMP